MASGFYEASPSTKSLPAGPAPTFGRYSFPVEDGPFELRAEELKLEQGFLHVVFEQSPREKRHSSRTVQEHATHSKGP